ncbi:adenylylsulfatase HINT3-like [Asparagus officinalis]|uniref:adenylylsulfatase HINT3-like n=1 Tax=Asparagus officinalis TaxID=4686 RepID=UPI00098E7E79|nr:adenylylsulfatase HINT3-like [Asparagus officinalis]
MQVVAAMCSKVPFLSNAIMKATQSDSFNLLVNNGLAAGQVIFHTHFHIIPRKTGDKLWPSENSRRRPLIYNENTFVLVDCIREQLSNSSSNDSCVDCESILSKTC